MLAASPSSVEIAYNQLQKVIAIRKTWKDWTRRVGRQQLIWLTKNGIVPLNIPPSQLFITPEELARRNLLSRLRNGA